MRETWAIIMFCTPIAFAYGESLKAEQLEILNPKQAKDHVGEIRSVCGRVRTSSRVRNVKGRPTFLQFGKHWPTHDFTAVVSGKARNDMEIKPERLAGSDVCVTGMIHRYRMKPQIEIIHAGQLVKVVIEDSGHD